MMNVERIKDIENAQRIARIKSREIMKDMNICDETHKNYAVYRYNLESELYFAIKKALKL